MPKLTDGRSGTIAKAEAPEKGQRLIFDDHRDAPRGFALRITAAGSKAFVLRYKVDGRERRKTIGPWPTWSAEAARDEARKLAFQIGQGHDPLEEHRRRKAEPTVADLATEWLDRHATGLASESDIRRYVVNDITPALGRMKVSDVRRRDVIEVVEAKAETAPRAAANVLTYLRKILDYAADRDIIGANPAAGLRPSSITVKGKRNALAPKARSRVLSDDEVRGFWTAVETCGVHRLTALALKMVLITGQRPGEVAGMHESEIEGRLWTIPAERRGKTQTEHTIHLTDLALGILDDARREAARLSGRRKAKGGGYVFETRPGSPITVRALRRAVSRYAADLGAKGEPWSPHDLRRTMRTGLSACRVRPDIAEMVIGHAKQGIVRVYDLHTFEPERRAALEAWEARLDAIVAGRDPDAPADNVVPIAGATA